MREREGTSEQGAEKENSLRGREREREREKWGSPEAGHKLTRCRAGTQNREIMT